LLKINKHASRSFNDLTAYPIFPWVINDYKSDLVTFEQQKSSNKLYRDFGVPTSQWMPEDEYKEAVAKYEAKEKKLEKNGEAAYKKSHIDWM